MSPTPDATSAFHLHIIAEQFLKLFRATTKLMLLKDERQKVIIDETKPFLHEHLLLLACKFLEEYKSFSEQQKLLGPRRKFQECSDDLIKWLSDFEDLKKVRNKLIAHPFRHDIKNYEGANAGKSVFDTGYYKELTRVPDTFQHINEIADILNHINAVLVKLYRLEIAHYRALLLEGENKQEASMDDDRDREFVQRLEKYKQCFGTFDNNQ